MRRALVATAAALAAFGCTTPTEPPADLTAVSFNLCGNVCAEGRNEADRLLGPLVDDGASVLLLQEVCRSQAEHLAAALDLPTTAYATTFFGGAGGANRCAGGDYGLAVLSSLPAAGEPFELPLPNPGLGRQQLDERKVVCLPLRWRGERLVACTSHLVRAENDAEAHEQQAAALPQQLLSLDDEHVVVGVDLNDEAAALEPARRRFRTAGRGVDHVLATRSTFAALDVERRSCDCSDHDALVASLRVQLS